MADQRDIERLLQNLEQQPGLPKAQCVTFERPSIHRLI